MEMTRSQQRRAGGRAKRPHSTGGTVLSPTTGMGKEQGGDAAPSHYHETSVVRNASGNLVEPTHIVSP